MISRILIDGDLERQLEQRGVNIHAAIMRGMETALTGLQIDIVQTKLHGDPLHQRSGNLANQIITEPVEDRGDGTVVGTIGVGSTAWYGGIHEFGGSFVGHRTIKNPPHMVTRAGGERVETGSPYGIHFPERSFLRSTLREDTDNGRILAWIEGTIRSTK